MATIGDTITAALQDLGIYEAANTPAAEDSALALARVNEWIDGLANEGLTIFTTTRTTWTISSAGPTPCAYGRSEVSLSQTYQRTQAHCSATAHGRPCPR